MTTKLVSLKFSELNAKEQSRKATKAHSSSKNEYNGHLNLLIFHVARLA